MSSLRVGIDVVDVVKLRRREERSAILARALHPSERHGTMEHLAGILAVKEAAAKALGTLPPPWREMFFTARPSGRPSLTLSPVLAERGTVLDVSIAHDGGVAVAVVVVQRHESADHAS